MTWRWYLTIAAVRQWMQFTDRGGEMEDSNPDFVAAQNELGEISLVATLAEEATAKQHDGATIYRAPAIARGQRIKLRGRGARAECTVMPAGRAEGDLPQLVRVTLK